MTYRTTSLLAAASAAISEQARGAYALLRRAAPLALLPIALCQFTAGSAHATMYAVPPGNPYNGTTTTTRLYTFEEDGSGLDNLGNIEQGGEDIVVTAIASAPDGTLYGIHRDGTTSRVVTLDPSTDPPEATTFSTGTIEEYLTGLGIDQEGSFFVVRENGTVQKMDPMSMVFSGPAMDLGQGPASDTNLWGADITFDANNECIITVGNRVGVRNHLFSCDTTAGILTPLTLSIDDGNFTDCIRMTGIAASVDDECNPTYFVGDGCGRDELGTLDYDAAAGSAHIEHILELGGLGLWYTFDVGGISECGTCGDGALQGGETCDDGNTLAADGCNAGCQVEYGYVCGAPGQPCTPTVCGDGTAQGAQEICDDGNGVDDDACGNNCKVNMGFGACQANTDCNDSGCGSDGTCGGLGADCTQDAQCVETCIEGTCSEVAAVGGTCDNDADCSGGAECVSGVCGDRGGDCDDNDPVHRHLPQRLLLWGK